LADPDTFALFNCMGTPMIEAMLPKVIASGIPFFAPFSGALSARPKARNVLNIRASYSDEAQKLVQHLATLGIKRIAIAYQNNAFGTEVFAGAQQAISEHKLPNALAISVESNGSDADSAAKKLIAGKPDALLVALAGKSTIQFIKSARAEQRALPLYALSIMGSAATLNALGEDGVGVAISQVVPSPDNKASAVARDFQKAWVATKTQLEPSHLALEGYINARVFSEVLRAAGRNPTRASFIDAAWRTSRLDLGGFLTRFSEPGKSASTYVDLTMVGRDGRFIR
jgi:ABC-type branched-subunit amino acid transport system substrate-binding protein